MRKYKVEDRKKVEKLLRNSGIHAGEADTLAAALILGGVGVMDGAVVRVVTQVHGIDVASETLFLLFRSLSLGIINVEEADDMLSQFVKQGLFLDSRTLLRAREKLHDFSE